MAAARATPQREREHVLGLCPPHLARLVSELGGGPLHARRLFTAVHAKGLGVDQADGLPRRLRDRLLERLDEELPRKVSEQISADGTRKLLLEQGGLRFESVFIPDVAAGERVSNTLCISSQTSCALGCRFCRTATLGPPLNLRPEHIVGQVALAKQLVSDSDSAGFGGVGTHITGLVFMGMGEPLLNYASVRQAIRILLHHEGHDFSRRRITVSTAGVVPRIAQLGRDVRTQLAVSLNATTDEVRNRLMPINRRWPLDALLGALRAYPLTRRQRITIEYVLLDGINDTPQDARRLPELLSGVPAKVNLLPLNAHGHTPLRPSPPERVAAFQKILWNEGLSAIVRTARGSDIAAACGQLGAEVGESIPSHES